MLARIRSLTVFGALCAVLVSCGGDGSGGGVTLPPPAPPPPPPSSPPVLVTGGFDRGVIDQSIATLNSSRTVALKLNDANDCTVMTLANTAAYNTPLAPNGIGDLATPGADRCRDPWTIRFPSTRPISSETLYVRLRATNTAPGSSVVTETIAFPLTAPTVSNPGASAFSLSPAIVCSGTATKFTLTSNIGPMITSMNTPYVATTNSYMGTLLDNAPMKFLSPTSAEIFGGLSTLGAGDEQVELEVNTPGTGMTYYDVGTRTNITTISMKGGWTHKVVITVRSRNHPSCGGAGLREQAEEVPQNAMLQKHGRVTAAWYNR